MSRGKGKVQRAIDDILAESVDAVWTTRKLCLRIFGACQKKHRVSLTRAIRKMETPGWLYKALSRAGCECALYNMYSIDAEIEFRRLGYFEGVDPVTFRQGWSHIVDRARETVAERIDYRDASPVKKLRIDIANSEKRLRDYGMVISNGIGKPDLVYLKRRTEQIAEMKKQLAEMEAEAA